MSTSEGQVWWDVKQSLNLCDIFAGTIRLFFLFNASVAFSAFGLAGISTLGVT